MDEKSTKIVDKRKAFVMIANDDVTYIIQTCGATAFAVYMRLLTYRNAKSQRAFPSQRTLADELGLARNTISAAIDKLVSSHLIVQEPEKKGRAAVWSIYDATRAERWAKRGSPVAQNLSLFEAEGGSESEPSMAQNLNDVAQNLSTNYIEEPDEVELDVAVAPVSPPLQKKKPNDKYILSNVLLSIVFPARSEFAINIRGFALAQLKHLDYPPADDLRAFADWWKKSYGPYDLTLGSYNLKNWASFLVFRDKQLVQKPKYEPRLWEDD